AHLPSQRRRHVLSLSFTPTTTTHISPLSLHDALPIYQPYGHPAYLAPGERALGVGAPATPPQPTNARYAPTPAPSAPLSHEDTRSEEHTSELQSRENLVCRLLLEKKKTGGTPADGKPG